MDGPMRGRELAVRAEWVDTLSWLDQREAAPAEVIAGLELRHRSIDELVMVGSAIPFSHFNMVLTLGCPAPVGDSSWQAIEDFYSNGSSGHWVIVNDHSEPSNISSVLEERGYDPVDAWDRIVLQHPRPDLWAPLVGGADLVTPASAPDWAEFIRDCYGMPPAVRDWLLALAGRTGWIHAVYRHEGSSDGPITMARSAFVRDGWAWLGIDAPVPGVMAPCFDDDQHVSAALLLAAASQGAHSFVTDIEVPTEGRSGPGYDQWRQLGFEPAYLRTVFHHR